MVEKGRLGPGQMLALDLEKHVILHDAEIKRELAESKPWRTWLSGVTLPPSTDQAAHDSGPLQQLQKAFGYSNEDLKIVLRPMGAEGQDAVWSMGDDTPVAPC